MLGGADPRKTLIWPWNGHGYFVWPHNVHKGRIEGVRRGPQPQSLVSILESTDVAEPFGRVVLTRRRVHQNIHQYFIVQFELAMQLETPRTARGTINRHPETPFVPIRL